jgi:hypothetical protein
MALYRASRRLVLGVLAALPALPRLLYITVAHAQTTVPLASWNDGAAKQAILDFIRGRSLRPKYANGAGITK